MTGEKKWTVCTLVVLSIGMNIIFMSALGEDFLRGLGSIINMKRLTHTFQCATKSSATEGLSECVPTSVDTASKQGVIRILLNMTTGPSATQSSATEGLPECVPTSVDTSSKQGVIRIPLNMTTGPRDGLKTYLEKISRCEQWRYDESIKLGKLVQKRLDYLQNPMNCTTARKLSCGIHRLCGIGCVVNCINYCFLIAYATRRTVVVAPPSETELKPLSRTCNPSLPRIAEDWTEDEIQTVLFSLQRNRKSADFFPPAVPADLAPKIDSFHINAFIWWIGQITKYVFRPSQKMMDILELAEQQIGFENPIVGVHIRRTDKLDKEASIHTVDEYMVHVQAWYNELEKIKPGVKRHVFLATDDPSTVQEIKSKWRFSIGLISYPDYEILHNETFAFAASEAKRKSLDGLTGILHDIYMLSKCDFLVCTFSSNVCRVAYQLMQTTHGDATNNAVTLDRPYWIRKEQRAIVPPTLAIKMPTYDGANIPT